MLNKGRVHRCARILATTVLLTFAGLGHLPAQPHRPSADHFEDALGRRGRDDPTFARPDVSRQLPALPAQPEETAPAAADAPEHGRQQRASESPKEEGVSSTLERASAPSDKDSTRPTQPSTAARRSGSEPQTTAATPGPNQLRVRDSRAARRMVRSQPGQKPKVTRVEQAARSMQAAQPTVRRGGQLASGRATWYQHPGRTASGEKYNPDGLTAAHRTLPLGARVRVVNKKNRRSVVVRINDRLPAKANAAIDLSRGSARALGVKSVGSVALQKTKGSELAENAHAPGPRSGEHPGSSKSR